jgi:glyoxylase-like metal-dependent hydrolase (beta-lactamase superfamily II)
MELVKGVHVIPLYANCALLVDDRLLLVDTGSEAAARTVLDYLPKARLQPRDIATIVLTHAHPDHVAGLHAVKAKAPGARVAAHAADADFVAQATYPHRPLNGRANPWRAVPVDDRLADDQRYEGLRVLHLPGHTPGSIALLDEDRGLLLGGDTFATEATGDDVRLVDGVGPMSDQYNWDPAQHRRSLRRLAGFDFEAAIVGHGEPLARGASAKLKTLVQRL